MRSSDNLEVGKKPLELVNTFFFQGFVGNGQTSEGQQSPYSDINLLLDRILQCNVSVENSRKVTVLVSDTVFVFVFVKLSQIYYKYCPGDSGRAEDEAGSLLRFLRDQGELQNLHLFVFDGYK